MNRWKGFTWGIWWPGTAIIISAFLLRFIFILISLLHLIYFCFSLLYWLFFIPRGSIISRGSRSWTLSWTPTWAVTWGPTSGRASRSCTSVSWAWEVSMAMEPYWREYSLFGIPRKYALRWCSAMIPWDPGPDRGGGREIGARGGTTAEGRGRRGKEKSSFSPSLFLPAPLPILLSGGELVSTVGGPIPPRGRTFCSIEVLKWISRFPWSRDDMGLGKTLQCIALVWWVPTVRTFPNIPPLVKHPSSSRRCRHFAKCPLQLIVGFRRTNEQTNVLLISRHSRPVPPVIG